MGSREIWTARGNSKNRGASQSRHASPAQKARPPNRRKTRDVVFYARFPTKTKELSALRNLRRKRGTRVMQISRAIFIGVHRSPPSFTEFSHAPRRRACGIAFGLTLLTVSFSSGTRSCLCVMRRGCSSPEASEARSSCGIPSAHFRA